MWLKGCPPVGDRRMFHQDISRRRVLGSRLRLWSALPLYCWWEVSQKHGAPSQGHSCLGPLSQPPTPVLSLTHPPEIQSRAPGSRPFLALVDVTACVQGPIGSQPRAQGSFLLVSPSALPALSPRLLAPYPQPSVQAEGGSPVSAKAGRLPRALVCAEHLRGIFSANPPTPTPLRTGIPGL